MPQTSVQLTQADGMHVGGMVEAKSAVDCNARASRIHVAAWKVVRVHPTSVQELIGQAVPQFMMCPARHAGMVRHSGRDWQPGSNGIDKKLLMAAVEGHISKHATEAIVAAGKYRHWHNHHRTTVLDLYDMTEFVHRKRMPSAGSERVCYN